MRGVDGGPGYLGAVPGADDEALRFYIHSVSPFLEPRDRVNLPMARRLAPRGLFSRPAIAHRMCDTLGFVKVAGPINAELLLK